ncbi:hypothetical protein KSP39_PZI010117 [Platanthera zijinensis]|uniref:Uncharacterized protein n=1 Tax=Platanthera zijinensis TaxID=2320716 RepID=A0AAP0BKF1_9ASPA
MGEGGDVDSAGEAEATKAEADDEALEAEDAGPGGGAGGRRLRRRRGRRDDPGGEGGIWIEEGGFEAEEGVGVGEGGGRWLLEEEEDHQQRNWAMDAREERRPHLLFYFFPLFV